MRKAITAHTLVGIAALILLSAASLAAQTAETVWFRATMLPGNVVPPVTDVNASGTATIAAHLVRDGSGTVISGSVDFSVSYNFPADTTLTGMHIHPGAAGVALPAGSGAVTIESGVTPTSTVAVTAGGGIITRQGQVTADNQTLLGTLRGMLQDPSQYFVDLHTSGNPGGVIRGQLQRAEVAYLMAFMTPANEVPPNVGLNASAVAQVIAIATRDASGKINGGRVIQVASYSFPGPVTFTGFHIHGNVNALPGLTAGVTISSGLTTQPSAGTGTGIVSGTVEIAPTQAAAVQTLADLFTNPGIHYINLHTTEFPGGAIRDQLHKADVVSFRVTMAPGAEVPAVTGLDASAISNVGVATLRGDDGSVIAGFGIFDVNFRFPGRTEFTGMHIHDGSSTVAGPVRIPTELSSTVSDTGFGNFYFTTVPQTGPAMLATLNSVVSTPENNYVNLHTTVNPGGAVRAQLGTANTATPTLSAATSAVLANVSNVAPLGLFTVFGTNLARVTTELGGGNFLPDSLGGATLTVGGRPARLLYVSPTQINAQVPASAAPGAQALVVNNGNGSSSAVTITVAATAPAIFTTPSGGAVLKNSDFSLVSSSNPATAGDILLIYSTGLGQTTPPLATGQLPLAFPLSNSSTVTVTIGGQSAQVIYSIAAPGFAGLYQTAVRVPTGVAAGNAPVVLGAGPANSNTVTIAVR